MKKLKLMTALIAVLLFSDLVFAGNPENLANKKIGLLSRDIALTDSQKVVLQAKIKIFAVKMQNANALSSVEAKRSALNKAGQEYKAVLDSILTPEQKIQLTAKRNERRDAVMNKSTSK